MRFKHAFLIAAAILMVGPLAYAVGSVVNGSALHLYVNSAADCVSGDGCVWWDGNTTGPLWRKADGSDINLGSGGGGGGSGTVTSVTFTPPSSIMSVSGSPITTSGTIGLSLITQNANLVFAGPGTGAAQVPTFRSLVAADIPSLSATYLPLTGGTLTGNLTLTGTNPIIEGDPSHGLKMFEGSAHNSALTFQAGAGTNAQINFQTGDVNIFSTQANSSTAIALLVNTNAAWTDPNAEVADFGSGGVTYLGIMAADGALTSTLPVIVRSYTASGSGAIAQEIDTTTTWSAGHLLNFQNNTAVKSFVAFDGSFTQSSALNIGTAQTAGITLENTTAATSGNQQDSPGFVLSGRGWSTGSSASQPVKWMIQTRPFQGGPSYANEDLVIFNNVNGAGYAEQFRLTYDAQNALSLIGGPAATAAIGFQASAGYLFSSTLAVGGSTPVVYWTGANFNAFSDNTIGSGQINKRWAGVFNAGVASCGYAAQSGTTYSVSATTDCQVGMTNAAARTDTLPAASTMAVGQYVELWDVAGTAGTANISVARTGSDTINGGTTTLAVVKTNSHSSKCTAVSSSAWFCTVN